MAADSAVMVIDGAKGVEPQTRKLFKVCALRHIPIFTFINKMDRETRDPLELCEEVERELGIDTYAMNWPIGCGKEFQGVYDREKQRILFFSGETKGKKVNSMEVALEDPTLDETLGAEKAAKLRDEVELLGAGRDFNMQAVAERHPVSCVLRFCSDHLRRGAVFGGIPADDHRTAAPRQRSGRGGCVFPGFLRLCV